EHFYYNLGNKIWSEYGFVDAFSIDKNWFTKSHLAIDQGSIIAMIENYRTGLIWKLFMNIPEIQSGLKKLRFESPYFKN
ncbi:glucoamylase family protein, partial [Stygiobacter electus]